MATTMTVARSQSRDDGLAVAFAHVAATRGWSAATLAYFCATHGITEEECHARWPRGIRSLSWELSAHADATKLAHVASSGLQPLSEVIVRRFADNEPLRAAVGSLARCDAWHPLDTLARTARTADAMWRCQDRPVAPSAFRKRIKTWGLVILYSACVLIWLTDGSASQRTLRAAVRASARILGAH